MHVLHNQSRLPIAVTKARNDKLVSQIAATAGNKIGDQVTFSALSCSCSEAGLHSQCFNCDQVSLSLLGVGPLPMEMREVDKVIKAESGTAMEQFDTALARFEGSAAVATARSELRQVGGGTTHVTYCHVNPVQFTAHTHTHTHTLQDLDEAAGKLRRRNTDAWSRVFRRPLRAAGKLVQAEGKAMWFSSFLLRRRVHIYTHTTFVCPLRVANVEVPYVYALAGKVHCTARDLDNLRGHQCAPKANVSETLITTARQDICVLTGCALAGRW